MLDPNPSTRITPSDAMRHHYFHGFDWEALNEGHTPGVLSPLPPSTSPSHSKLKLRGMSFRTFHAARDARNKRKGLGDENDPRLVRMGKLRDKYEAGVHEWTCPVGYMDGAFSTALMRREENEEEAVEPVLPGVPDDVDLPEIEDEDEDEVF
ncbi:hypothetical protein BDY19DRAFT_384290 [Irpex rosettiformis]|uniref:Uncharacterized protein n=1 Tax=Irpex rosettiformis TaxID=378272 RepID=A0ACB8TVR6_9APHY|nr:hypothetical protein BDY19DRAFT_384290 [Irpex rosettiformis]